MAPPEVKPIIGKVNEFNGELESFENYIERLENFFSINKIEEQSKISYFVSVMGPTLYSVLKNLLHPKKVGEVSYAEAKEALNAHYIPKVNSTYERFIFNKRSQKEGESISEYAVQIKKLASTCNFNKFLDEALRDRFLCGLKSPAIQSKLLAEGDSLTFTKALELALLTESANRNVKQLHPDKTPGEINLVKPSTSKTSVDSRHKRPTNKGAYSNNYGNNARYKCFRCGKSHDAKTCPYSEYKCFACKKKGHLSNMCKAKEVTFKKKGFIRYCDPDDSEDEPQPDQDGYDEYELYTIAYANDDNPDVLVQNFVINGTPIDMVIDTGAVVTVMPDNVYFKHFYCEETALRSCDLKLKAYNTNDKINVLGEFQATVSTDDGDRQLPIVVIEGAGSRQPTLLGRNWLSDIKLDWNRLGSCLRPKAQDQEIHLIDGKTVPSADLVSCLKEKYASVFDDKHGEIRNMSVDLILKDQVTPVFCKARSVPFALRGAVEQELENLQKSGVIYPVTKTEWSTPIVVVPKPNNKVRICGDFKVTLNPNLRTDYYPLPNPDDILSKISGAKFFSKLDLRSAYNQLRVNEYSQPLLTITTHKGLFRYAFLPYGITSAGALFQSTMDKILAGLKGTHCYLDDILIFSKTMGEMKTKVEAVLKRLAEYGVKVNNAKSEFFKKSILFLGFRLDDQGIHQSEQLTEAIVKAPVPQNMTQLRSYLGLINFYGKFLPNLSTLLHPLYRLLNQDVKWVWCEKCDKAFQESKRLLMKDNVLMPFNPGLDIVVTCDSSQYGVGAVISHSLPDGSERPIAFASRTLTKCEEKYSQIEKEALAIVFAVKKFHNFLYGRQFTLVTDHRPLIFLLGQNQAIPTLAAARIQRWALTLATYRYEIRYRKGSEIQNADALSRLPTKTTEDDQTIAFFSTSYDLPITSKEIATATKFDPILSRVLDFTINGWPSHNEDKNLSQYFNKSSQLSVDRGCILWGSRVVIPPTHRKEVLLLLHTEHPGESRMKALARSFVWWPGMDAEIESIVKDCSICQKTQKSAQLAPLQPWSWPKFTWQRVHLDFASFEGKEFLILVDSHSKWLEIFYMTTTTSKQTIEKLRHCFAAFSLPSTLVTDGGPQFTSAEFKEFAERNGIHHILSPPYHPASNGLAERAVQTVKDTFLKQMLHDTKMNTTRSLQHRIDSFLFTYRNTPHSITGISPSEAVFKFKPRTHLSLLKPSSLSEQMQEKQGRIVEKANQHRGKARVFEVGDNVYVRTVRQENVNWQPGVITKVISPVTYLVKVDGRVRFVHADHLRVNTSNQEDEDDVMVQFPRELYKHPQKNTTPETTPPRHHDAPVTPRPKATPSPRQVGRSNTSPRTVTNENVSEETDLTSLRRSQRNRRAPPRLDL